MSILLNYPTDTAFSFQIKKEAVTTTKAPFYNSYEMYRRENISSPASIPAAPQNLNAPPGNYARNNNQHVLKNKFQNVQIQDSYFPGYYATKQQEYFGKHEAEYPHAHQKAMAHQLNFHNQKADYTAAVHHNSKSDFPHLKADFNHKIHPDFHPKSHDFHHQNQMYYSHENNSNNIQYQQGQGVYYHQDYDAAAAAAGIEGTAAVAGSGGAGGYYDPKTQAHYYENYNQANEYQHHPDSYNMPAGGQGDNCDNFNFAQYYEAQQQHQQQHHQLHHQAAAIGVNPAAVHALSNSNNNNNNNPLNSHPHIPIVAGATVTSPHIAATAVGFQHSAVAQPNYPGINPNNPGNMGNLDNSNSSSDFNFLSNLANDFAPEYYQLS